MTKHAIFDGLVYDEEDNVVETIVIGNETFYKVNDAGFMRHISSSQVDRQIFDILKKQFEDNKDAIIEQTAKILGQDDPFSQAVLANQFENFEDQFNMLMNIGIPENDRLYLGMTGFRAIINIHGDLIELKQPTGIDPEE